MVTVNGSFCVKKEKEVSVHVGVRRRAGLSSEMWGIFPQSMLGPKPPSSLIVGWGTARERGGEKRWP